jgi:3-deoxy-D-manno-octulosonic-acid transferase
MYFIYNLLLLAASPFLALLLIAAAASAQKYRSGLAQKMGFFSSAVTRRLAGSRPVWIHAVSVGEVMAAIPLLQEMKGRYPRQTIVLSTVTATGNHTAALKARLADAVIYFPFDYPFMVRRAIKRIHPRLFITMETELWPNFLREMKRSGVPSVVVSGRISNHSYRRYRLTRRFFRRVLANIDAFYMQTEEDARRIISIGADRGRVITLGNLKCDQEVPLVTAEEKARLYSALQLKEGRHIFIAGSTHRGEEEMVLEVFKRLQQGCADLTLILAPRHPERFGEVANLVARAGYACARKTELALQETKHDREVILLDTIGELSKLYSIGTIIFVGGSLVPTGGHNVLEPVVYRKAVLFGPHMDNFQEIARCLMESGGGLQVNDLEGLFIQAKRLLENESVRNHLGEKAFQIIASNQGTTRKAMEEIGKFLMPAAQ